MRGGPWPGSIASCIAQNSMPKTAEFMIAPLLARPPTTYLSGQNSSMPEGHFRFHRQYSARLPFLNALGKKNSGWRWCVMAESAEQFTFTDNTKKIETT